MHPPVSRLHRSRPRDLREGSHSDNHGATLSPGPREPGPEEEQIYGLRRSEGDRPTDRSIARLRQRHGTMRLPVVR